MICLFVGIYFGTSEIIDRFYFLREEFSYIPSDIISISRFDIIKFAFSELNNFILFGYGSGSFESLFQLKFINSSSQFANHAHSDLVEFFGEFGLVGITFIILSIIKFFLNKENYSLNVYLIVLSYAIILLYFDFSLHIQIIQILFVIFLFK